MARASRLRVNVYYTVCAWLRREERDIREDKTREKKTRQEKTRQLQNYRRQSQYKTVP